MKTEDKIKAISELDGWKIISAGKDDFGSNYEECANRGHETILVGKLPKYLTSRDAIIPVIEKQPMDVKLACLTHLHNEIFEEGGDDTYYNTANIVSLVLSSAEQLSDAMLKATGKWIE